MRRHGTGTGTGGVPVPPRALAVGLSGSVGLCRASVGPLSGLCRASVGALSVDSCQASVGHCRSLSANPDRYYVWYLSISVGLCRSSVDLSTCRPVDLLSVCFGDTTTSRDSPCMQQDPTPCSILAQALVGFMQYCCTALSSEGEMSPGAVVQKLQTQISPFQSTLRAKDRVQRCIKRIAYLFSLHSASFRG